MKKKTELFLVFAILFSFAFYLINYDFSQIVGSKVDDRKKIPSQWLDRYGLVVLDDQDLDFDNDKDGLSLIEEYTYKTNPLKADTDDDGYSDGQEVKNGYSPVGEGKMDYDNDKLPDFWELKNGLSLKSDDYNLDPDGDGLLNYLEYEYLTNPQGNDTDGDGYDDLSEIENGYDPTVSGDKRPSYNLIIEKLGVTAPLIFSASFLETELQEDLKSGVIIYPETGIPGQIGNTVISGHSSNYSWVKGAYNYVFKDLNSLNVGDNIVVEVSYKNERKFEYRYTVLEKDILSPDNEEIFGNSDEKTLTITTCWPLGTNFSRLVLKAKI
ncbi:sortase domain-bontaining protein [Patescibacteria group bacterium]